MSVRFLKTAELEAGLDEIRRSPKDGGLLQLIVRRPHVGEREVLQAGELDLPPGTRVALGSAVIEVTAVPHTGCKKFVERYGLDAVKFVNAPEWKDLHLRGINAKVVRSGAIHVGDVATRL